MTFKNPFAWEELISVDFNLGINRVEWVHFLSEELREAEVDKVQVGGHHSALVIDLLILHQVVGLSLNIIQFFEMAVDVAFWDVFFWEFRSQKDIVEFDILMDDIKRVQLLNQLK